MKMYRVIALSLLFALSFGMVVSAFSEVPVILYHNVATDEIEYKDSLVSIPVKRFEEHIRALINDGYIPISFNDYIMASSGNKKLPQKPIIITFDDGYLTNYTLAFPVLKKYNAKATIFVVTGQMGSKPGDIGHFSWKHANDMQKSGLVDIYSHTHSHIDLTKASKYEAIRQIRYSKYLIEKNLGTNCRVLAFPYGFHNNELVNYALTAGYDMTVQVGNKGINIADDIKIPMVRITVHGVWSGEDLLTFINQFHK